jgi:radical SAM protein with 4Fe4S-binding SPASM domain
MRAEKSSQEFLEEHFKGRPHLTSLQIELTSRCNERCIHCYIPNDYKNSSAASPNRLMSDELYDNVLNQCREMGLLSLTLSGGEPMCHPHFVQFLRKAKEYDFSINILSNLTLLNDEILREMKENRLSSVQVSLYSMKPEVHDAITTVPGSFYKTRDAILTLIDNDIPLQVSCPTMKQNKDDYVDVLNWCQEHKVRAVTDYIMKMLCALAHCKSFFSSRGPEGRMARFDHSTGNLDNRLSLDEVGPVIDDIIKNDSEYQKEMAKADIIAADERDTSDDIVCGVGVSSICMIADGTVYPCAGWQDYDCGNVQDTPLKEIWDNSPRINYLRNLRKKDFPKCLKCPDKSFCAMCMVRNANENQEMSAVGTVGNPLKINEHFCKVAALNRKIVLDWKQKLQAANPA